MPNCSICKNPFTWFGNNAEPINNWSCCDTCNATKVIPARLKIVDRVGEKKVIEGVYCDKMKYKRFDWMTKQQFYDMNKTEVEDYIMEKYPNETNRHYIFGIVYSDIMEWD